VTRPRAADDFATINARLAELRRERELAVKQQTAGDETPDGAKTPRSAEPRSRGDRGEAPSLAGRRYLPARQR
jgi:hypothetical protein